MHVSLLEKKRREYQPKLPSLFNDLLNVCLKKEKQDVPILDEIRKQFPKLETSAYKLVSGKSAIRNLRIGAFFSGGQAPGGHNVIAGIWDAIQKWDKQSTFIGFLGGPSGLLENQHRILSYEEIDHVRNLGGFDLLGSGRAKIETEEQMQKAMSICNELNLDGLVVIGGDDSNTNAAFLAEYFLTHGCSTKVVGVPKTIDGDLQSVDIEIPFGFDSATKVYSEMIGNIMKDALSSRKYYHFIKLMGRSASHITLECALSTHPNLALIGEEKKTLSEIVDEIANLIEERHTHKKDFGVILIPEGLIEFMPEMKELIRELNQNQSVDKLSEKNKKVLINLPEKIQKQLLSERDPHGNIALSQIETEYLLIELVTKELQKREFSGKFNPLAHFFGYEGRSCLPSNFDANYCYSLGILAAIAVRDGITGMICSVQHLFQKVEKWHLKMVPIIHLIHLEERKGKKKPVIQKTLVSMIQNPFLYFKSIRDSLRLDDQYKSTGPMQFFGDEDLADSVPKTLKMKSLKS